MEEATEHCGKCGCGQAAAGVCLVELAGLPDAAQLDYKALAHALGVHPKTIRRMAARRELPPGIRQGGRTLWSAGNVRAWIGERAAAAEREAKRQILRFAKISP